MKVNFFKLNKNRKFNYTPRFYKGKDDVPATFESKFSVYRESYNSNDIGKHWADQRYKTVSLYTSPSPRDRTRSRMPSSA